MSNFRLYKTNRKHYEMYRSLIDIQVINAIGDHYEMKQLTYRMVQFNPLHNHLMLEQRWFYSKERSCFFGFLSWCCIAWWRGSSIICLYFYRKVTRRPFQIEKSYFHEVFRKLFFFRINGYIFNLNNIVYVLFSVSDDSCFVLFSIPKFSAILVVFFY